MGFWLFLSAMNLVIPFIMIGFGTYFRNQSPKEINMFFGYRTKRSMKNKETWKFAHTYCGKLWILVGCMMLVLSSVVMLLLYGKTAEDISALAGVVSTVQVVFLVASIFPTEIALKKTFDENGNRRL